MSRRVKILVGVGILVVVGLGWWLVSSKGTHQEVAVVNIESEDWAAIWISHNNEDLREVGQGKYQFSSEAPGILAIRASGNLLSAQATVNLVLGQTQEVHLPLSASQRANYYAPGSVSYPLITDNFVYGIGSNTNDLSVFRRHESVYADRYFLDIPKIRRLGWLDLDNFVYASLEEAGVSLVVEGSKAPLGGGYLDFSLQGGSVFLLSRRGVDKIGFGEGQSPEQLIRFEDEHPLGQVFASDKYIYVPLEDQENHSPDPSDPHIHSVAIGVYTHQGDLVRTLGGPTSYYLGAVDTDKFIFLASYDGLLVFDLESGRRWLELELEEPLVDVLELDGVVYSLTREAGLWSLDTNKQPAIHQLVASQSSRQYLVEHSMVIQDGRLYFSAQTKEEALDEASSDELSSVYYIELDSN